MLYICITQYDAQTADHHVFMAAVMQPPFKFWYAADDLGHLIPAPKG